jgi:hypothetical protein
MHLCRENPRLTTDIAHMRKAEAKARADAQLARSTPTALPIALLRPTPVA